MQSQEIPSDQWIPFLNDLSRRHQGDKVTIELMGNDVGDQREAQDMPLLGITVDPPAGQSRMIEVMVGDEQGVNIAHDISHPIHVRLAKTDAGADVALEIEAESGPRTLVRFMPYSDAEPA